MKDPITKPEEKSLSNFFKQIIESDTSVSCNVRGVECYNPTCLLHGKCVDFINRESYSKWKEGILARIKASSQFPPFKQLTAYTEEGHTITTDHTTPIAMPQDKKPTTPIQLAIEMIRARRMQYGDLDDYTESCIRSEFDRLTKQLESLLPAERQGLIEGYKDGLNAGDVRDVFRWETINDMSEQWFLNKYPESK